MIQNKLNILIALLMVLFISLLVGCTTHFTNFTVNKSWIQPKAKLPINLAVIANEELCSYTVSEEEDGHTSIYHVGATICENIQNIFSLAFQSAQVMRDANSPAVKNADAIAYLKIIDASLVTRRSQMSAVDSIVVLEWTITNRDGKILYANTLKGVGKDDRLFSRRDQESMGMCLNDLLQKLNDDMLTQSVSETANLLSQARK